MKNRILILLLVSGIGIGTSFAQNKTSPDVEKYQFGEPEHLLDGYSMNFQYQTGNAIHIEFYDGKGKYEWITGPGKGNGNKDIQYRCRKIGDDLYLMNWHETGLKDYLTLVFNFKNMTVYSSVIIGYENNPDRPRRTAFDGGIIDHLKRPE
ncbi:MoaF-related domain-containing protein [Saccharicrinis sp. GN24d3]|uniref:MoaF-related domain-containing protein n=1 Tax=Saccharicrinis sp. GN24d3 TaxID=3458416 RepID=UPI0040371488